MCTESSSFFYKISAVSDLRAEFWLTWARINKHLLEAEKSTFQEELSFQRSESTTGNNFFV
jgi:hypothetical protein